MILKRFIINIYLSLQSRNEQENNNMKKSIFSLLLLSTLILCSCSTGSTENDERGNASTTTEASMGEEPSSTSPDQMQANESTRAITPETKIEGVTNSEVNNKPIHLNAQEFKEKVFNYEKNPQVWTFEGDKPCIIDFYADWCKPCKLVAPIMDELAEKYAGKINIYKVDTQVEKELAQVFGIRSIPSVLFCPTNGQPQMTQGALPKETFEQVITDFLLAEKPATN